VGLGSIAAAAAVFALVAPRQRTQVLRWVESEYRVRLDPGADAISDTARALRPAASAATSTPSTIDRDTAQLEQPVPAPPPAAGDPAAAPRGVREMTPAVTAAASAIAEDSSAAAASAKLPNDDLTRDAPASGSAAREPVQDRELSARPSGAGDESS